MDSKFDKQEVRTFYDSVGWKTVGGVYQNSRFEDMRPVSQDYIHRCHLRVNNHLTPKGKFLLDAGSGPVQYKEYLSYSEDYAFRVCLDISILALLEARKKLGDKGLFVVADVANLPFSQDVFDGIVSLHTLHHLPDEDDQKKAYGEFHRVLRSERSAVVVNGWTDSPLMKYSLWFVSFMERFTHLLHITDVDHIAERELPSRAKKPDTGDQAAVNSSKKNQATHVKKINSDWIDRTFSDLGIRYQVFVWRSVNVRFLRGVFHTRLGGRFFLNLLFRLEERFPHFFGTNGQYPLLVFFKDTK